MIGKHDDQWEGQCACIGRVREFDYMLADASQFGVEQGRQSDVGRCETARS